MTKREFIDYVMDHGGVQNDDKYVYVSTPAGQSSILVTEVLGRIENHPFYIIFLGRIIRRLP